MSVYMTSLASSGRVLNSTCR